MMKWYVQNIPEARVPSHPSMRPVSQLAATWQKPRCLRWIACEKVWWIFSPENCLPTWAKKLATFLVYCSGTFRNAEDYNML